MAIDRVPAKAGWRPGLIAAAILAVLPGTAQIQWTGAGSDDSWGTAENWAAQTVPPTPYSGSIQFAIDDLGNTSRLDADRVIAGTEGKLTQGLHVNPASAPGGTGHTLELETHTLTLNGGSLQVGYNASNAVLTIRNGMLCLGDSTAIDLFVGAGTLSSGFFPGNRLTLDDVVLDTTRTRTIAVGRSINGSRSWQGVLDLCHAVITAGGRPDTLALEGDLQVGSGYASQASPRTVGELLLPTSLRAIEVRDLYVGYERYNTGIIDFGAGSLLTNLTVRRNLYLSSGAGCGEGYLINQPAGIGVTVGTPAAPGSVRIAWHDSWASNYDITGRLAVVEGRFTAHLSELIIGWHKGSNEGKPHGILDLSRATVKIGSAADHQIHVPTLLIGSRLFSFGNQGGAPVDGLFRIPPAVTHLVCGNFYLGNGANGRGILDIGADSQLRTLTVTNGLYLGGGEAHIGHAGDAGWVDYLPNDLALTVGSPSAPARLHIGRRPGGQYPSYAEMYPPTARLILTNGSVHAWLAELAVGVKEPSTRSIQGVLDLRGAEIGAFSVAGSAFIGAETNKPYYAVEASNQNGKGLVHLRAAEGEIGDSIFLGDTHATSFGLLDLDRSTLVVQRALDINTTGLLSNRVYSTSSGIDLTSPSTNALRIATGGGLRLVFQEIPADPNTPCWGLRLRGDRRADLHELAAAPARLSWDTAALPPEYRRRVGIHYDAARDVTFVGMDRIHGTILLVR